ncbi:hypothetical protein DFQ28_010252 [Apophysomyces sp. BC1034]|nr:hypothetical protein DFQ30_002831 [Apophysomyces sp. BC1015]KAG0183471.1 hypothetical protein DFQ29_004415 [Apophysomyces sp. BC1021]KAG0192076.1 hypothetical protein DFQ28_010252 [Apophysomyces sp. BC1034]
MDTPPFALPSSTSSGLDLFDLTDDDAELNERLTKAHIFDNYSETTVLPSGISSYPWLENGQTAWYGAPVEQSMKNIWKDTPSASQWDRFEPYSQVDESEFDPTLQYYRGSLLDNDTMKDIHLLSLSVTNPSYEETQADNVGEDMSALQMLQLICTDQTDTDLEDALARNDYDLDRTMEELITKNEVKNEEDTVKKRQVCRHYLAGECYRKDCWFAHDLQIKVCKFWLRGSCLKGDHCEFSHYIDAQEVVNKISSPQKKPVESSVQFDDNDYPELSQPRKKLVQVPVLSTPEPEDEFPSLASAAKARKPTQPTINFARAAKKTAASSAKVDTKKATSTHTRAAALKRLTQPVQIPWLETGNSLNTRYMEERKQAIEYGMLRNRFFKRATEYYLKGDGAKAKAYSSEAKHYNRLMQEMHVEASRRIFEERNQRETYIDLHGLHVDEAIDMLQEQFDQLQGYKGVVYIVTGTGHHSGASGLSKKQSKLRPNVEIFLRQHSYRFAETSVIGDKRGGIFAVDLSL